LNPRRFGYFTFIFISFEESCLLVSWCAGDSAAWCVAMRIVAGVGDLLQRTRDSHTGRVLGGWTIERLSDDLCGLHRARGDEEHGSLG
jgi:hypothetical protein